mgnify:CR=1 FL=1
MPVKYRCPKCERRFVDWGAEKLGYKCPECVTEKLVRVGAPAEEQDAPTLSRRGKTSKKKPPEKPPEETVEKVDDEDDEDEGEEEMEGDEDSEEEVVVGKGGSNEDAGDEEDAGEDSDSEDDEEDVDYLELEAGDSSDLENLEAD